MLDLILPHVLFVIALGWLVQGKVRARLAARSAAADHASPHDLRGGAAAIDCASGCGGCPIRQGCHSSN